MHPDFSLSAAAYPTVTVGRLYLARWDDSVARPHSFPFAATAHTKVEIEGGIRRKAPVMQAGAAAGVALGGGRVASLSPARARRPPARPPGLPSESGRARQCAGMGLLLDRAGERGCRVLGDVIIDFGGGCSSFGGDVIIIVGDVIIVLGG